MKPRSTTSPVTPRQQRQRQQWRRRKAEARERARNPRFPGSTAKRPQRDPIAIYPAPLPKSELDRLILLEVDKHMGAGFELEGDQDNESDLEWRRRVGRLLAHHAVVYRRFVAELSRYYPNMPALELRRLVERLVALTNPNPEK